MTDPMIPGLDPDVRARLEPILAAALQPPMTLDEVWNVWEQAQQQVAMDGAAVQWFGEEIQRRLLAALTAKIEDGCSCQG